MTADNTLGQSDVRFSEFAFRCLQILPEASFYEWQPVLQDLLDLAFTNGMLKKQEVVTRVPRPTGLTSLWQVLRFLCEKRMPGPLAQ